MDDQAFADRVGNAMAKGTDFPIPSLRQFLLPSQLTYVQVFSAVDEEALMREITAWVDRTQNIVVVPGVLSRDEGLVSIAVSYVPAVIQPE